MSSIIKFENKDIGDYTEALRRSFISNARSELKKLHAACGFGKDVKIRQEIERVCVNMDGLNFRLSVDHDCTTHTTITLYKKQYNVYDGKLMYIDYRKVYDVPVKNLMNEKLISELVALS